MELSETVVSGSHSSEGVFRGLTNQTRPTCFRAKATSGHANGALVHEKRSYMGMTDAKKSLER